MVNYNGLLYVTHLSSIVACASDPNFLIFEWKIYFDESDL